MSNDILDYSGLTIDWIDRLTKYSESQWIVKTRRYLPKETKMSNDRIGDHCWGQVNDVWVKGHLRRWLDNPGGDPTTIFESKGVGNLYELKLNQLNFEKDKPT